MQSVIAGLVRQALVAAPRSAPFSLRRSSDPPAQSHRKPAWPRRRPFRPSKSSRSWSPPRRPPWSLPRRRRRSSTPRRRVRRNLNPRIAPAPARPAHALLRLHRSRPRTASKPLVEPVEVALVAPAAKADLVAGPDRSLPHAGRFVLLRSFRAADFAAVSGPPLSGPLYDIALQERAVRRYPLIGESAEIERRIAAFDEKLGQAATDRGRLLDAMP